MKKEKPETKTCKHCKTEIPYGAKVCPQCRKKQTMGCLPKVLITLLVLVVLGALAGGSDETTSDESENVAETNTEAAVEETTIAETEPEITYTAVTVSEMRDLLDSNAMKASETYKDQYLEITGKLSVIDSNGKYISLVGDGDFEIIGVQCYLKTDEHKTAVMEMSTGDTVTLRGKCTDVGEVLGYYFDIDSIE